MSRTTKFHRQTLAAAKKIVAAIGGDCRIERNGGGHAHLMILVGGGRCRKTPLQSTPKNADDALAMKLADVRRIVRQELARRKD